MAKDVALDLGTASTQVATRDGGLIIDEPTVAAVDIGTGDVLDIGRAALQLAAQSPTSVDAVWPMQHGVVDDDATLQRFITRLIRPLSGGFMERMRLVAAVPSTATPIERRTIRDASKRAGVSEVHLVEQVIAAALGGDLPVHEPIGSMVVNVGAGITEAALLSLGSVVAISSVRAGGADVNEAIRNLLRRDYGVLITDDTAEDIKITVGRLDDDAVMEVPGELVLDGSTVTAIMERSDVATIVDRHVEQTIEAVRAALVQAPPELAQDVSLNGIHFAGGGALLAGLPERVGAAFSLPVHTLADPAHVVVRGAGKCVEAIEDLKPLFLGER